MLLHLTALCFFWFLCSLEVNEDFHQDFKFWALVDWLCPHNCSEDVILRGRLLKQCIVITKQTFSGTLSQTLLFTFSWVFLVLVRRHSRSHTLRVFESSIRTAALPAYISSVLREMLVTTLHCSGAA